jgi:hypothetical protein
LFMMRCFISAVALLVKVTARIDLNDTPPSNNAM